MERWRRTLFFWSTTIAIATPAGRLETDAMLAGSATPGYEVVRP